MKDKWQSRFESIRGLGWVAMAGAVPAFIALLATGELRVGAAVIAACLIAPAFIYTYVVVIWHWKDRYVGRHSDLWGAVILLETSGWMKIVYLFRHIIPDMRRTGRYERSAD